MNTRPRSECFLLKFPLASEACVLSFYSKGIILPDRISEEEYVKSIKEEISKVVRLQEELDIDVLVHGEPEVSQQ